MFKKRNYWTLWTLSAASCRSCCPRNSTVFNVIICDFEHVFFSQKGFTWSSIVEVAENHRCPRGLAGWGISVASVSPDDCVEVKQLSVAEGHEADSGEVRLTGSHYAVRCPQTEVLALSLTLAISSLLVSKNTWHWPHFPVFVLWYRLMKAGISQIVSTNLKSMNMDEKPWQ